MRKYLIIIVICLAAGNAQALDAISFLKMAISGEAQAPEDAKVSSCGQSVMQAVKVCDIGAGFLCVDTPPFGVASAEVELKGTIDVKNNALQGLFIFVQHEYTKKYWQVDVPLNSIDKDGRFKIKVPLSKEFGAYSITVTASRENGSSSKTTVRTAYVTKPAMKIEDISISPDPWVSDKFNGQSVTVNVDLLHSCLDCDFFGVGTGAVEISLTNSIISPSGAGKRYSLKTNVSASVFSMCVPVSDGKNKFTISACNAASGAYCPTVTLKEFTASTGAQNILWENGQTPLYHARDNPFVELAFKLESASDNVKLSFNRDEDKLIYAEEGGVYRLKLKPQAGINIGTVSVGEEKYPFTFGWGDIVSPFVNGADALSADDWWIDHAGGFSIRKTFFTEDVKKILNNFLKSDDMHKMLEKIPSLMDEKRVNEELADAIQKIKKEVPFCKAEQSEILQRIKLVGAPKLSFAEIASADIGQDVVKLVLNLENVKILAQLFKDDDADFSPDGGKILPLKIAFRKIFAPVEIQVKRGGDKPAFVLESEHTDCEYKSNNACTGMPAPLVPKNFVGNATPSGGFVVCDTKEQAVDEETKEACVGINILNAQTGLISTKVLDAINEKLHCDVSAGLTYFLREWMKVVPLRAKLFGRDIEVPIGLDLLSNQFSVDANGVFGVVPALVGGPEFFNGFQAELKNKDVGYISRPGSVSKPTIAAGNVLGATQDIGLAFGSRFLNALLFLLTEQGQENGLLDWDIDEAFFNELGFDFVKECDEFVPLDETDKLSALCNLRPRVGELLGSALTTAGYYPQKQALLLRIRGNRRLPPHIEFMNIGGKEYFDVQLGDIDVTFYALEAGTKNEIISFKFSAIVPLELTPVAQSQTDAGKFQIGIRPEANATRIIFTPIEGGNKTIIKDSSLLSAFEEKIKYGVNIYSQEENMAKFELRKEFELPFYDEFSILGLEKITFGKDGLSFKVEDNHEYIDIFTKLIFTQFGGDSRI